MTRFGIERGAKELGVHTAIDTSGYLGAHCSDAMLADIDLVLLDVKSGIPETYKKTTGRELQPTLDFGRRVAASGTEIWVRFVLVPGLTDAPENVDAVADYVASLSTVSRVEVLPFHQMGRDKWQSLGLDYELEDTQPPSPELVARVQALGRRSTPALPPVLERHGVVLDVARHTATRDGRALGLSPKEFGVLHVLMRAGGRVVSAEELLEQAWDEFADPFTNAVRVTVMTLRKKLGQPSVIHTVPKAGYRIGAPE